MVRLTNEVEREKDILTEEEEVELRKVLEQMVETVKTYCEKN